MFDLQSIREVNNGRDNRRAIAANSPRSPEQVKADNRAAMARRAEKNGRA